MKMNTIFISPNVFMVNIHWLKPKVAFCGCIFNKMIQLFMIQTRVMAMWSLPDSFAW